MSHLSSYFRLLNKYGQWENVFRLTPVLPTVVTNYRISISFSSYFPLSFCALLTSLGINLRVKK